MHKKRFIWGLIICLVLVAAAWRYFYWERPADQNGSADAPGNSIETAEPEPEPLRISDSPVSLPVFMYHELGPGPNIMYLSEQDFSDQMRYLQENGYETITMSAAYDILSHRYEVSKKAVITFDDGYESFYTRVWPILKQYNQTATLYVITDLVGLPNYVNWDQIRTLSENGIEIGAHTKTHRFLTELQPDSLSDECGGSKQIIENQIDKTVSAFCYPTGKYNQQVVDQVRAAGFTSAVTMEQRRASSNDQLLVLPRWGVYKGDPLAVFIEHLES